MVKEDDISFLGQLIDTLHETSKRIAESYEKKDYTEFNQLKKLMLRVQENIDKILSSNSKKIAKNGKTKNIKK